MAIATYLQCDGMGRSMSLDKGLTIDIMNRDTGSLRCNNRDITIAVTHYPTLFLSLYNPGDRRC